eukprot:403354680
MKKATTIITLAALLAATAVARHGKWTYYWICYESDESGSGAKDTWLKTCKGKNIAQVTRHYAERVRMEGTGKLNEGSVVNLGDCDCGNGFSCFEKFDAKKYPFGIGSNDNPIYPYVSVASNDEKVGTTIMVEQLKNVVLPGTGGQKHNGCVRVDDQGWSFGSNHLDFFVAKEKYYHSLDSVLGITSIDYQKANCKPLNYNFGVSDYEQEIKTKSDKSYFVDEIDNDVDDDNDFQTVSQVQNKEHVHSPNHDRDHHSDEVSFLN